MWSILFSAISAIPGLAGKFLDWQVKRANIDLEGFKTGAGVDLVAYQAYLQAQTELNRMKLAQNSWWGAKVIILTAGLPAAIHFGAVMLDSTFLFCSCIPKVPAPYDGYEWLIVQSFFLMMPAMTGINAVSQWLNRKR